ncbi:phenylalanine--tRNA ligase subunit beta [Candidatus Peregrinibacteria bacterium]|nr:phenylalanine--tRNA ligase subunit beta [Candidatus Peregrinibacteria bacterium]
MRISLNWIKKFGCVPAKYSAKCLAELLTLRTAEVEGFEDEKIKFANMVIGQVIKLRPHSNADKLHLADTDIGGRTVQIVCGGINLTEGMIVAVALPGAIVDWHGAGETVELKETKIRGELSFGMICAGEEIGLPASPPEYITDMTELWAKMGIKPSKPGTPLAESLNFNDIIFEIDNKSLTHRPDLWGHFGMAREFAAILGKKLKPFALKINFPKTGEKVKIEFKKPNIASRFLSAIITGVKVEESPEWLKRQLETIGMKPVNNIVDATNFVMHEFGHPMHAFDRRVVKNDKFVIRFAKNGETIEALDHKRRALLPEDALVTNGEKALAIAGIMGGRESEITPQTTEIILEVATWNPVMIRKTSSRLGLRTDAAQRFEKSLDPCIAEIAFKRVCELILEICKGSKLAGPLTDVYPKKYVPISVTLDVQKTLKKIGADIKENEMAVHLAALGFGVKKAQKGALKVTIPSWRATKDVNIEDDLVEEIARMHGYEKIKPILPTLAIRLPRENRERNLKHFARQILSFGLGFDEIYSYSFYGAEEMRRCLLPLPLHIGIENPLTEDQTHMRISLLPNMLKAVKENLKWKKEFKIYEIGRSYIKVVRGQDNDNFFPVEEKFICGIIVRQESDKEIFYDALGALQTFLEKFGAKDFQVEKADSKNTPPYSHPSKCAIIKYRGKEIAVIYEIHPQVLKNFNIENTGAMHPVCATFEINFTHLVAAGQTDHSYKPLPRFPGIEIDISVLAQQKTEARQIFELIKRADNNLIANISLVDIFSGKSLGEDKKSFTFRVLLQSPDRTLTDAEMKQIQEKIFEILQKAGFAIRGL